MFSTTIILLRLVRLEHEDTIRPCEWRHEQK